MLEMIQQNGVSDKFHDTSAMSPISLFAAITISVVRWSRSSWALLTIQGRRNTAEIDVQEDVRKLSTNFTFQYLLQENLMDPNYLEIF